jgi:hypothetical protein
VRETPGNAPEYRHDARIDDEPLRVFGEQAIELILCDERPDAQRVSPVAEG